MVSTRRVTVRNLSKDMPQPLQAKYCSSFLCRLRGLTFRRMLPEGESLLLVHLKDSRLDTGIHMLGVSMDLAIVWINSKDRVVDVRLARRWRPMYLPSQPARYVLEMSPARLDDFRVGDRVSFEEVGADS
jgi:uncharacterized membrane protein (UPF0127 family)